LKLKYPTLQLINKSEQKPQDFGEYRTMNLPPGHVTPVAHEDGEIEILKPGFHKLPKTAIIRETLPSRPLVIPISLKSFHAKDLHEMRANFSVQMEINEYTKFSNHLQVEQKTFRDFIDNTVSKYIEGNLLKFLRQYNHYEIVVVQGHEKVNTSENIDRLLKSLYEELDSYSKKLDLGIQFVEAKLVSDVEIADVEVRNNYYKIEKSKLSIEATRAENNAKEEQSKSRYLLDKNQMDRSRDLEKQKIEVEALKSELQQQKQNELKEKNEAAQFQIVEQQIKIKERQLEYEEKEKITRAKVTEEEELLKVKTLVERRKLEELNKSKILQETAKIESDALKLKSEAKAYEIFTIAKAEAEKIEMENKAKETMSTKHFELEQLKIQGDNAAKAFGAVFQNGLYHGYAKEVMANVLSEFMKGGEMKLGGYGVPIGKVGDTISNGFKTNGASEPPTKQRK